MRTIKLERKTNETDIKININLDGNSEHNISTGIGFFDHMLTAFIVHSGIDMELDVKGDLEVDCHHTIEDVGIVIGQAIGTILKDKSTIMRYGNARIPMDEALGECVLDISGRAFLVYQCEFRADKMGEMETQMVEEFFRAVAFNSGITLHISSPYGTNDHHKCEAMFKAFAHSFKMAVKENSSEKVLSSKGVL